MSIDVFTQHFSTIEDPRQSAKISYPLFDVLFLTICAVITGCEGWEEIEDFGVSRSEWLKEKGLFKDGLPVHDTIARIVSCIEPCQLQRCFVSWMRSVSKTLDGEVIAIDGKTLRGSYNRDDRKSTIHMVSAFATANGGVMGQVKTAVKSNEITAIPELLELLDLKGCLVTIDAMGCQKEIAQAIVDKDADYLLALKASQNNLHLAVCEALKEATSLLSQENAVIEKGHGRFEIREYHVMNAAPVSCQFPDWPELKTVGVAISYRATKGGKESIQCRYTISSADLSSEKFTNAVRSHWGIENKLHWVLDTAMNEDGCQIYRGNAAENLACTRHIGLNMLRAEKTKKASVPRKQRFAAMETGYLDKVLLAGFKGMSKK